jgi:hypothetical protein
MMKRMGGAWMNFPPAAPEPLLIYDEDRASRVLGESRRKVRQFVRDGHIEGRQLPDGRLIITREALIQFIQNLPTWGGYKR